MKKIIAVMMLVFMISLLALPVAAGAIQEVDFQKVAFEIKKANVAQKLDGKISEGEYYKVDIKSTWLSTAVSDDANVDIAKNLNPELYMSWDEKNLYIATVVTADRYILDVAESSSMWQQGCIQVNAAGVDDEGENRLEFGIGRMSASGDLVGHVWAQYKKDYTPEAGKNFTVSLANNVLTYEAAIPWDTFLADPAVKVGGRFGFCLVWSTGNNYIHTQLASGCTGFGKHADYFAKVTLADAPIVEKVADKPTAAQTSDASVILYAVTAIISTAGVVMFKKKK